MDATDERIIALQSLLEQVSAERDAAMARVDRLEKALRSLATSRLLHGALFRVIAAALWGEGEQK
jgi:hypothetical protein